MRRQPLAGATSARRHRDLVRRPTRVRRTRFQGEPMGRRRSRAVHLLITAAAGVALVVLMELAPAHAQLSYATCEALQHRFEYGVAMSTQAAEQQVWEGRALPAHGPRARNVYRANRSVLDTDLDGTACES